MAGGLEGFITFNWDHYDKDDPWQREVLHAIKGILFKERLTKQLAGSKTAD